MTSILQISDTHFGTEQALVVQALEDHVDEYGADLLVFSGDITQRARNGQFAAAAAFMQRLRDRGIGNTLVIPGNHDIPLYNLPLRFLAPYRNYRRHFGDDLEPVFENERLLVIGLNTTAPRRHKNGLVTPGQVERVARLLRGSDPGKLSIVVAHQPFGAMVPSDVRNRQHGAQAALECWAAEGLDLVMGGHVHLPHVLPLSGQYAHLAREVWMVQAGTTFSSRVRGTSPNSFNRLRLHDGADKHVTVERWDLLDGHFAPGSHFELDWDGGSGQML
ncbi:metallophosphoesterase family protein [Stutzerimonas kirkiae]|uniref:DNA repair exonuclease n=2 Tax=Stutzerimonas kirkiae TaxID=2211392 RepID=A0A4Q9RBW3_9GAMM|nr:metallophosphoesterase [Stutzerimonas kirkiae]TBU97338.1 DNA repair exonuclease [Stutzerimonas kirkiae]TBV02970.1 DNA repair exonuclease [Stutzerimonas kirkiae]TBV06633.1 DNA repair exonuclease [Stutzerimonas kirkiae]